MTAILLLIRVIKTESLRLSAATGYRLRSTVLTTARIALLRWLDPAVVSPSVAGSTNHRRHRLAAAATLPFVLERRDVDAIRNYAVVGSPVLTTAGRTEPVDRAQRLDDGDIPGAERRSKCSLWPGST